MKQIDFTRGNARKALFAFFFPMLFANILQQAYSFTDMVIISKCIGDNALAAVGNFTTISFFIIGFATGITNGFAVNISHAYGSKENDTLRKVLANSIKLSVLITAILTIIGLTFLERILVLMQTDTIIFNDSLSYGYIIFGGLLFTISYNLCSSVLRAFGDSKTPFLAIFISAILNIILDLISIYIFNMGIKGPAYATIISQGISAIICFSRLRKIPYIKLRKKDFDRNVGLSFELLKNGIPMAFMNSVTSVGCIFVQGCINSYGVVYTSAYSACNKYINLFMLPGITMGFAVSSFTGQNYGAKKFDRIKEGIREACFITAISSLVVGIILLLFPNKLATIMLSGNEAIEYTISFLRIFGFILILLNLLFVFRSCVQGLGKPILPMLSGFIEMIFRIPVVFVGLDFFGFKAIIYAEGIAWMGALAVNVIAYIIWIKGECGAYKED